MPPKKATSAPQEKDIYLFLVEADDSTGVHENHGHLLKKLVSDKIFAESPDIICVARMDNLKRFKFEEASWNILKEFYTKSKVPAKTQFESGADWSEAVIQSLETVIANSSNDYFREMKVLVFGNFSNFSLKAGDLKELKEKVEADNILLTVIFPMEPEEMDQTQKKNFETMEDVLQSSENVFLRTYKSCLGRVMNIVANKAKRSMPWKVVLEIRSGIEIPVRKLIVNRKEAIALKNVSRGEEARTTKETVWTENDGSNIDESGIGYAYEYGEKLVTLADEQAYETGDMCLQLLVFCPRENILPSYVIGEGADIFFPQEGIPSAFMKFDALLKALIATNTVAVVKKIWRKNTKVVLGVLSPDEERQGLIMSEICFADDISIPHFPLLIKEAQSGEDGITEKDSLIDSLIKEKSIEKFRPQNGPVNPKVRIFRDHVVHKVVHEEGKPRTYDNVELFFKKISASEDVVKKIKAEFALTVKKEPGNERPAGKQVFRKRVKDEGDEGRSTDKKAKLAPADEVKDEMESAELLADDDYLFDDL